MALEDKQADPFVAHAELSALAEVCRRCGELKLNGELLDAAVRVAPNTLARDQLLRAKYCALYEHGRRSEAIAGLESLLKDEARAAAAPTNIAATKLALCGYLQMAGEAPAALKLAQEVLYDERLRGDYLRAASLRTVADLIAFTRGPEQQLLFAESANRIDPSANFHRNWLRLMGDCCLQRGRLSEALDYYERTLAAFPDVDDITTLSGRGEVCLVAGDILMSLGKYEAAVKYFRKGAELCSVRRDDRETLIPLYLRLVSVEKCLKIPDLSSKYAVVMNYATEDLDPRSRCLWLERFSTLYDDKVKRRSMLEKAIEATRSFPDQEVAKFRRLKLERLLIGCDEKVNLSKVMGLINQWEPLSHVERNSEMAALCIVAAESVPTQDKELWSKWAYRAASFSAETPAETVMIVTQALAVQAYLRGYKHLGDQFRQKCAAVPIPAGAESLVLIRMESQRVFAKALAVSDPAESERLWALAIRTAEERRDQFSAARTWHMRAESTLERDPSKAVEYYLKSSHIYAEQKSPSLVLATMQEALVVIRPKNKPDLLAKLQNELAALRK
ncbi:MAG: hypothetical protein K2W95_36260 [Candidatus Obscuribacterales bacterium]|nr:hypothetical protein [Candidatus Obscuribacterales bacterium]